MTINELIQQLMKIKEVYPFSGNYRVLNNKYLLVDKIKVVPLNEEAIIELQVSQEE